MPKNENIRREKKGTKEKGTSMLLLPQVQVQVELRSSLVWYPAPESIVVSIHAEIFCDRASMVQVANEAD